MSAVHKISVTAATGIVEAIAAAGASPDRVLRAAGVERAVLARPDAFIASTAFAMLLEQAAQATRDPCFGLRFGERFDPRDLGMLTYVVVNSPTVESAMHNVARYVHLHNGAARVWFAVEEDRACLRYVLSNAPPAALHQHNEFSMAVACNTFRAISGQAWAPREVQLTHESGGPCDYLRAFGCPARFGQPSNALVVDRDFVERTVAAADPKLYGVLARQADRLLAGVAREDGVLEAVRRAIGESLECGDANLERVAAKLATSTRTLERRLKAHGAVYRDVLSDTRKRIATDYLRDRRQSLTDIAFRLGYSEVSAFNRAFKRWTGSTPLEYRGRHAEEAAAAGVLTAAPRAL